MKTFICLLMVSALLETHGHAAPAPTDQAHFQMSVALRDGSRVVGQLLPLPA